MSEVKTNWIKPPSNEFAALTSSLFDCYLDLYLTQFFKQSTESYLSHLLRKWGDSDNVCQARWSPFFCSTRRRGSGRDGGKPGQEADSEVVLIFLLLQIRIGCYKLLFFSVTNLSRSLVFKCGKGRWVRVPLSFVKRLLSQMSRFVTLAFFPLIAIAIASAARLIASEMIAGLQ